MGQRTEDDILTVTPRRGTRRDEELKTMEISVAAQKTDTRIWARTWEELVFGPRFAIESSPALLCFKTKFSSAQTGQRHSIKDQHCRKNCRTVKLGPVY